MGVFGLALMANRDRPVVALRARWSVGVLVFLAVVVVRFLDATYLAGPLHCRTQRRVFAYWLFVLGVRRHRERLHGRPPAAGRSSRSWPASARSSRCM